MKTVGFIHTALVLVEVIKKELSSFSSEMAGFHMVDESLLIDLMKKGQLMPPVIKRLCQHVVSAEEAGAEIIVVTCSSISPAVDVARKLVNRPVLKIDEPMAEAAVKMGGRIGILATVATTLEPTSTLLREKAAESGKSISLSTALCQEAFQAVLTGDLERHDQLIIEKGVELANGVDVVVLAQGSMARMTKLLSQQIKVPVLSSPSLFAESLKSML